MVGVRVGGGGIEQKRKRTHGHGHQCGDWGEGRRRELKGNRKITSSKKEKQCREINIDLM